MDVSKAFMRRAITLAAQGRGRVEPNPQVGVVVAREGRLVGEGCHERFGGPHAEVNALRQAGEAARGADLYVTLEPCCTQGKTPPCTDAILAAGVGRVIIGAADPTQRRGTDILRRAGVRVIEDFLREDCERLIAPFLKLRLRRRPYVTAKWAMTADGKIATYTRDARWISGEPSRRVAHELRRQSDAVVVGIETVLTDDPLLTCRLPGGRNPRRVVLDRRARLPLESRLVWTASEAPVWVFCKGAEPSRAGALRQAGCEVFDLASRPEQDDFDAVMAVLGERDLTHVLIEGGSRVFTAAFACQAVDEVRIFTAPKLIGGERAPSPLGGFGIPHIREAIELVEARWRVVGQDVLLEARVQYRGAGPRP